MRRRSLAHAGRTAGPRRIPTRRAVTSVLAMMFLIVFGSLVAAMAVASTGNIRTASMHLQVMRAMSAAETGMEVAERRLREATGRFIVSNSDIDADFVIALWNGNSAGIGDHEVAPPRSGHPESGTPAGLAQALVNHHLADVAIVTGGDFIAEPVIGPAPQGAPQGVYRASGWVYTPAVQVEGQSAGGGQPPAFQIRYAPLADGEHIRIIADGISFDYTRNGQPVRRTVMRDFRIVKKVEHAVISPSRIMIGKNVLVEGDLGARFEDIDFNHGDPIVMKSDFYGLDPILDQKLEDFWDALLLYDVDGDNRLRLNHPVEGQGVPSNAYDYSGDGLPDNAFIDMTGDGFLDEFDIFLRHFDSDGDGRVTLSQTLIEGTPAGEANRSPEFVSSDGEPIDDDLAVLIDSARPDRNRNGVFGYLDVSGSGWFNPDAGDQLLDPNDQELGYRDGFLDAMDQYAKVRGQLIFRVSQSDWIAARGDYRPRVRGPIVPPEGKSPVRFGVGDQELPDISPDTFVETELALRSAADGDPFWSQVAAQLGVSVNALTYWDPASNPAGEGAANFIAVWPDDNNNGLPDNHETAYFERMPFNSPAFSDWYYRPVFRNFVFRNVEIPKGVNGLFINCTFVGVTYVRSYPENNHPHWSVYGRMRLDPVTRRPVPEFSRWIFGDSPGEDAEDAPPMLPSSAIPPEEVILISNSPLDKGDVLQSQISAYAPEDYAALPDPLVIDGKRIVDTKKLSNNIRFHDCLFVGSIVSDTPQTYTQVRNKMQFTGATRFTDRHPDYPDDGFYNPDPEHRDEIARSSMMLPHYSVDIGSFNSPPEQDVRLNGAIIAGVLDARGNTTIDGALLLTFRPEHGAGPLKDVHGNPIGNPANFNATLGSFGPEDGDWESLNPRTLPYYNGVRIVGWDLNGDGLADLGPDETPTQEQLDDGAVPVPFHGYGRVILRHNPDMLLPSGIRLPLNIRPVRGTYREGSL